MRLFLITLYISFAIWASIMTVYVIDLKAKVGALEQQIEHHQNWIEWSYGGVH